MRTKNEAAKALMVMGWSRTEIKSVLGDVPELEGQLNTRHNKSFWWNYMDDDWYVAGTPAIEEWEDWIENKS